MPKVSVIIPTYNREKYIVETVESVFAQTFTDYEVIVIDDGSTDNTSVVLKPYLDRITYIRKQNGGQGSARNAGIKIAKGEYIAFLDSDDLWLPEKLEKQVKYLDQHPNMGLVFTDYIVFSEEGALLIPPPLTGGGQGEGEQRITFAGDDLSFNKLFKGNFIANLTVMIRRDCIEQVGYFDESRDLIGGEDYEMWLRIAMKYKVGHIPDILAEYRVHGENVIGPDFERGYTIHLKVINSILNCYPEIIEEFHIDIEKYYRDYYYRFARYFYEQKQYGASIEHLRHALSYDSFAVKARILYLLNLIKGTYTN